MELFYSQEQYDEYMSEMHYSGYDADTQAYIDEANELTRIESYYADLECEALARGYRAWDALFQIGAYLTGHAPAQPDFSALKREVEWQIERQAWTDNGEIPF